tara:strand:+ start:309 stop:1529 length:1221 start_codon:yes stop_codon:yes gene_type:complete
MPDKFEYLYSDPTITTSADGDTPYGIYDKDSAFISESVDVCKYVARKLGHPVMQLEFNSSSIYACFEEAISDYSLNINHYNTKNWLWDNYGNTDRVSGSGYSNNTASARMGTGSIQPTKPTMGMSFALSEQYGTAAGVGGSTEMYSGSITLSSSRQVYDLQDDATWEHTTSSQSSDRLEIQRVFNYGPAAITRFYDPFAGSFDQRHMLDDMGMGNVSPSVSFIMRPIHQDITRANMIETNDRIRKSAYSFELINNKLRIFPIPQDDDAGNKVWFHYYLKSEKTSNTESHTINKVSDPSNIPYKFITYSEINAAGRQWIRRYTLALAKELLGIIRSKYGSMPIPTGDVTLDGEALKAEGREEKATLIEELKEFLESVSLSERARQESEQAEAQQSVLNKAPLGIYIG